jgi:hypothetical protein
MSNKKFRVWDKLEQRFVYPDKGYQGHYTLSLNGKFHNLQNGSGGEEYDVQQFLGILDANMKEIYEGDVVKFETATKTDIGVIVYNNTYCAYSVEVDEGFDLLANIPLDSLEILGNIKENYIYSEFGVLMTKEEYEKSYT